jgi:hypothetical protein
MAFVAVHAADDSSPFDPWTGRLAGWASDFGGALAPSASDAAISADAVGTDESEPGFDGENSLVLSGVSEAAGPGVGANSDESAISPLSGMSDDRLTNSDG